MTNGLNTIKVDIDEDYGAPTEDWLTKNGFYLVQSTDDGGSGYGIITYVIADDEGNFFTYDSHYRGDGCIVWHIHDSTIEATRCYMKVKMVATYYYENTPNGDN